MRLRSTGIAIAAAILSTVVACGGDDAAAPVGPAGSATTAPAATGATTAAPTSPAGTAPPAADLWAEPAAATAGGALGSACPQVGFQVPAKWQVQQIDSGLMSAGGTSLCAEVDAKPAGILGFLRVWAGDEPGADVKATLQDFVADWGVKGGAHKYRQTKAAGKDIWEAVTTTGQPERMFAVATPSGVAIVSWRGVDGEEYTAGLPAYVLAKQSLTLSGR